MLALHRSRSVIRVRRASGYLPNTTTFGTGAETAAEQAAATGGTVNAPSAPMPDHGLTTRAKVAIGVGVVGAGLLAWKLL